MALGLPVPGSIYERAVLFDTSAFVALIDRSDKYHLQAVQTLAGIRQLHYPIYVTLLIVSETHRQLLYRPHAGWLLALHFLEGVLDGANNVVPPLEEDAMQAIQYIKRFSDQPLTFTDAVSMAVMRRLGLNKVFTFDWHFTLLGFQVLPGVVR